MRCSVALTQHATANRIRITFGETELDANKSIHIDRNNCR